MKMESELNGETRVSFFESLTDKPGKSLEIGEVLDNIRTGVDIKDLIESIRGESDKFQLLKRNK
jgi:hypothetical protein